jgi:hypothetical protein
MKSAPFLCLMYIRNLGARCSSMRLKYPSRDISVSPANELRIDAAEMDKVKTEGVSVAASIRVERSRTPEDITLLGIKAKGKAGKTRSYPHLHQSIKELYMEKECFCRGKKS